MKLPLFWQRGKGMSPNLSDVIHDRSLITSMIWMQKKYLIKKFRWFCARSNDTVSFNLKSSRIYEAFLVEEKKLVITLQMTRTEYVTNSNILFGRNQMTRQEIFKVSNIDCKNIIFDQKSSAFFGTTLFSERVFSERRYHEFMYPDLHRDIHIPRPAHRDARFPNRH